MADKRISFWEHLRNAGLNPYCWELVRDAGWVLVIRNRTTGILRTIMK